MPRGNSGSSSVCIAMYGIGPNRSATTGASSRNGLVAASPSSVCPDHMPSTATMGLPCTSSGRNGNGGAVVRLIASDNSSGCAGCRRTEAAEYVGRLVARVEDETGEAPSGRPRAP